MKKLILLIGAILSAYVLDAQISEESLALSFRQIEKDYEAVSSFSEGLAAVEMDNQWCFIDNAGKVVIKRLNSKTLSNSSRFYSLDYDDRIFFRRFGMSEKKWEIEFHRNNFKNLKTFG